MTDDLSRLAQDERLARLTGEARDRSSPNVRPADAATLILVDRRGKAPRVLMGKRHAGHKFMPGKFVFPGGRAERGDGVIPARTELAPPVAAALAARVVKASAALPRRLALAAIRETFEETGLVLGGRSAAAPILPGEGPWRDYLATGYLPDLAPLGFLARAITPPRRPKRFDTRFFVADADVIAHQVEGIVSPDSELVELAWLTIEETAGLPLPAITRAILAELHDMLAQGGVKPARKVPFYFERHGKFRRELIG